MTNNKNKSSVLCLYYINTAIKSSKQHHTDVWLTAGFLWPLWCLCWMCTDLGIYVGWSRCRFPTVINSFLLLTVYFRLVARKRMRVWSWNQRYEKINSTLHGYKCIFYSPMILGNEWEYGAWIDNMKKIITNRWLGMKKWKCMHLSNEQPHISWQKDSRAILNITAVKVKTVIVLNSKSVTGHIPAISVD